MYVTWTPYMNRDSTKEVENFEPNQDEAASKLLSLAHSDTFPIRCLARKNRSIA